MFQSDRHETCIPADWNEAKARAAIGEIAASAIGAFDPEKLWASHPLDGVPDGIDGIYFGAAGVILALDWLNRAGLVDSMPDYSGLLPTLIERDAFGLKGSQFGAYASLFMGDLGPLLLAMQLRPDQATSDRIHDRIAGNDHLPLLELMWGTPGSMLAGLFMLEKAGGERFAALFRAQARRLLADIESVGDFRIWLQDLYGRRARYIGLVHGFAGNMFVLIRGWNLLSDAQKSIVAEIAQATLAATAKRHGTLVNWPANADEPDAPMLCQICHGAPGILAAFAGAPFSTPAFEELLRGAGELVWLAGPLSKGSNFCHGTGGNAYALLKLHKRTGETLWLERARVFAMHAIEQWREATREYGRGRYALWTGDPGLAICLLNCITGEPHFPSLDSL